MAEQDSRHLPGSGFASGLAAPLRENGAQILGGFASLVPARVLFHLHVPKRARVNPRVSPLRLLLCLLSAPLFAAPTDLERMLKAVETRYNRAQTLQVVFHEAYTGPGRPRRTESGTLLLRKPGRMRWDYTSPQGKLFVSDGKYFWLYTPGNNQVENMKIEESDDTRAALAFLLSQLRCMRSGKRHYQGPLQYSGKLGPISGSSRAPVIGWWKTHAPNILPANDRIQ